MGARNERVTVPPGGIIHVHPFLDDQVSLRMQWNANAVPVTLNLDRATALRVASALLGDDLEALVRAARAAYGTHTIDDLNRLALALAPFRTIT